MIMDLTYDQLLEMVKRAHEECKSECMNCPWCIGHMSYSEEWHDQFCLWPKLVMKIEDKREHERTA